MPLIDLIKAYSQNRNIFLSKYSANMLTKKEKQEENFLITLTKNMASKDTVMDIFVDFIFNENDELAKINKTMNKQYIYKYDKVKLRNIICRLDLVLKFDILNSF